MRSEGNDSPDSGSYLGRLTRNPLLGAEEELALARAAQAGDGEARAKLVESNMRLVINIARSYIASTLPLEDLIQEGAIGLIRAVERFDPDRGFRFSTYATHWIRQSIRRAVDGKTRAIRVPAHVTQAHRRIERERERWVVETGREPTATELAQLAGLSIQKLEMILQNNPELVSLDIKVGSAEENTLGSVLPCDEPGPDRILIDEEFLNALETVLADLSEREQFIIRQRIDSDASRLAFRAEMGRQLKLSRERVRQLEASAIQKLRHMTHEGRLGHILPS
ncbi:MAG: RNA polymerase sigma factor RpoD/SigA [Fimbriimonadaceae bacterium]|nr:RNA polymerase sigma factor RpoD/SigA [Fimbriimonadaceae bacterium]